MKTLVLENNLASLEAYKPEGVLIDWLTAITNFHSYYYQVVTCISQSRIEQDLREGNTTYIGQCPMSQLLKLRAIMKEELKKLGQDIDQLAKLRPSNSSKNYKKLTNHTQILSQLNQQAQNSLYLVTLSSS